MSNLKSPLGSEVTERPSKYTVADSQSEDYIKNIVHIQSKRTT